MISAGPTYEAIDPVRFIGNYSSGLMGISIADEIAERGGEVSLICGPTHLKPRSASIKRIDVSSAEEMLAACSASFQDAEIGIMSAAVADFKPAEKSQVKIKKSGSPLHIDLHPTTDILATLGKSKKPHQFLVGFALETNNEIQNALKKLQGKNLDMIVLNSLKDEGAGFGTATNKITLINRNEDLFEYDLKTKAEVAKDIADFIVSNLHS